MIKKSLIVVDVQNDFCPGGALAVAHGDGVVAPLNKIIARARNEKWLIVASRDWHPADAKHFDKWPVHCVKYTRGSEFRSDLDVEGVVVISKPAGSHEDGYSAFEGNTDDGQDLEAILLENGVIEVYVGGLATDYCVKATAIDAARKGFKTFLLLDVCRAVNINPDDGQKAVEEMLANGVEVTSISSLS